MDLSTLEYAVQDHLRPQEQLKYILPAQAAKSGPNADNLPATDSFRILAIVTNVDYNEEEGSIFVFQENEVVSSNDQKEVELQSVFPLTNILNLSVAQGRSRSGTLDLRPGKYAPPLPPTLLLSFETEEDKQTFIVESSDLMRAFIENCRRLIKASNTASNLDFRWLGYYRPQRQLEIPLLFPRPDLRHLQRLPHEELSHSFAGESGDSEPADSYVIRDHWMRNRLFQDKSVYVEERRINIRLGTFNVNGKTPSQDVSQWIRPQHNNSKQPELPPLRDFSPISLSSLAASDYLSVKNEGPLQESKGSTADKEPDLLVIGFQELDLSTEALIYSYTTTKEEQWLASIFAGLGEVRDHYVKVSSKQLVGMLIICIAKKELIEHITDIRTCTVGAGFMGLMGNKGASAVRLRVNSTVISFVNAHLAAFDDYEDKRNADFHDLSHRLLLETPAPDGEEVPRDETNAESIFQSDAVFWMVNLNYRISLPDTEVRQMVAGEPGLNVRDLLAHDQLTLSRFSRKAFEDFKEGEIKHIPTYRFSAGVATDALGYDIKRRPAYTDRILYIHSSFVDVQQKTYTSHPEITMSDHRPVSANFSVGTWNIDGQSYYLRARELARHLGHFEELEDIPRLNVDISELSFGDIRYKRPERKSLSMKNTGNIPCAFRLVALSENETILPKWLTVTPQMGILLPDEPQSLTVTVLVEDSTATQLNIGDMQLRHTLILHTLRGKDYFIPISGNYLPTCFANDLEILIRLPGPIRQLNAKEMPLMAEMKAKTNAPREVIRLINWLMSNAAEENDLFLKTGEPQLIEEIREALDSGHEFEFDQRENIDNNRICHSVAHVLVLFLESLPTSLIPASLQERCAQMVNRDEAFELLTALLPSSVLNVWISLTAFLHYIAQRVSEDESKLAARAEKIACIFAPILMQDGADSGSAFKLTPVAKRRFLLNFIG